MLLGRGAVAYTAVGWPYLLHWFSFCLGWVEAAGLPVVGDMVEGAGFGGEVAAVGVGLVVAVDGHQGIEQVCFAGGAVKVGRGTSVQGDVALGGLLLDGEAVAAGEGVEIAW